MRFGKPAALVAALILAACQNQSAYIPVATSQPGTGAARGIDMATDASDVIGELQGRPWLQFVARYYRDPASRWPALTPNEVRRLSALGLKIVTVWEWHSGDPAYFTYATGYNDALNAARQARNVGQPPGSAIYFAVDFNARGAALYQVDQYFGGVNAGLAAAGGGRPDYKVGVYGSGAVCAAIRGARLAQYAWLSGSSAWDGTASYSAWNIKQAAQGARFSNLSFSHDANEARNDYGGFRLGDYAASPAGAVVTAAASVPAAAAAAVNEAVATVIPQSATPAPPAPPIPPPAPTVIAAAPAPTPVAPTVTRVLAATATPVAPTATRVLAAVAAPRLTAPAMASFAAAAPTPSAAEVAALAAAEPAPAVQAARATIKPPRAAVERPSSSRASEQVATREATSHERAAAHAAKGAVAPTATGSAASVRKAVAVAANNTRAAAVASRHPSGVSLAGAHETERRVAAPRRAEDHVSHLQTAKLQTAKPGSVHVSDRPERRSAEQRKPERAHRTRLGTS